MKKKKLSPAELEAVMEMATKATTELRQTPIPDDLTTEQINDLLAELEKCEVLAYKCKIGVWVEEIQSANPSISFKETLMETLKKLPDTLSVAALKELIEYTGELWSKAEKAPSV